jgi:hypothetical protein
MSVKKKFLLRLEEDLYKALEKWAADELRSVNAQIEFILADAAVRTGRAGRRKQANREAPLPPA